VGFRNSIDEKLLREVNIEGFTTMDAAVVDRTLALLQQLSPVALCDDAMALDVLARLVFEQPRPVRRGLVRTAWTGETLPRPPDLFAKALGVPILSRYASCELGAMARQVQAGGPLHVIRPWLYVEMVDGCGRPLPRGLCGRLLWTSTLCRGHHSHVRTSAMLPLSGTRIVVVSSRLSESAAGYPCRRQSNVCVRPMRHALSCRVKPSGESGPAQSIPRS
jgi:hypothetical protein